MEPLTGLKSALRLTAIVAFAVAGVDRGRCDNGASPLAPAAAGQGIRPDHLWTTDYLPLLLHATGATVTAPRQWGQADWTDAALAASAIGGTAAFDQTIRNHVQSNRSASEDRFMKDWQNLGSTYSFGVLGLFELWGEASGDVRAKNTALDGLTGSIIAAGLINSTIKYAVGRVRPTGTRHTFVFKPFSGNMSFASGHSTQAFAIATAIAENYPSWWVQTAAYGSAALVGYARIEQNAHFASDVVAGAILGWTVTRELVHRHNGPPRAGRLQWTPYSDGRGIGIVAEVSF